MQEKQNFRQLRQYYRIRYPRSYRPRVSIEAMDYEGDIVELSERGVRFICKGEIILSEGANLKVTITFHDGDSFELNGEILKVTNENVIVRFIDWLPLIRIIKEQIYLRNHFVGHM
jgi:hypothetical protein